MLINQQFVQRCDPSGAMPSPRSSRLGSKSKRDEHRRRSRRKHRRTERSRFQRSHSSPSEDPTIARGSKVQARRNASTKTDNPKADAWRRERVKPHIEEWDYCV